MRKSIKSRFYNIVIADKITKFVTKLFGMRSEFKVGENVCLTFDRSRKFQVVSDSIIKGKIQLVYFNENKGQIECAEIEPKYLTYSYIEGNDLTI